MTFVAISPDGRTLASASNDNTLKLWDVATGRELRTFAAHSNDVTSVSFAPDGRTLASASGDKTLKLWDVATGRELRTFAGHSDWVNSVTFAPDGRTLASASQDKTVKLWDVATGHELRTFAGHSTSVSSVTFAPDGRTLASVSQDNTVKRWNVATGRELRTLTGQLIGHYVFGRNSVAFAPDGRILASASWDRTLKLWDVATGRELRTLTRQLNGHSLFGSSVAFTPDGRTPASTSGNNTLKLWDVATGRELRTLTGHASSVNSIAFAPDGQTLVSAFGNLKLWDVASGHELRSVATGHAADSIAFAPNGRILASASWDDGTLKLWDVAIGRELRTLTGQRSGHPIFPSGSVAFTPDGRTLAATSGANTLKLWDIATGHELRTLTGHANFVTSIAFAPDGQTLVWSSDDKTVKLWDVVTGRELRTFAGHSNLVNSVAVAPDGRTLASASRDKTVKLWDIATGHELRTFAGHSDSVNSVAFAPDGHTLASASRDKTLKLWDVATGRELRTFIGHSGFVPKAAVAFAPDGRTLASASQDGTVILWNVATGNQRVALISFADGSFLTITPEGYYDASSEQAEENLNVCIGDQVVGIGAFREKFYRPDLVKLALAGHSLSQFARLDQVKPPPRVEFVDLPLATTQAQIGIKVRLADSGGGIGNVRLFLNGSAVAQDHVRDISVLQAQAAGIVRTYTVRLVSGRNELRAVAFNADDVQSNPAIAEIMATIAPTRPSLHAVVVGIQDFKNPQLKLKYPTADARHFANILRQYAAPLFHVLNIKLLVTPAATTRDSLLQELRSLRQTAGPEDLFVFFVASHGTVDDGKYFLLTSNVGSASTEKLKTDALGQADLKELFANIPATKKLIIVDTCNAAALGDALQTAFLTRGLDDVAAMKILSRAVGSTVLSASTSTQQALEGYQGHGLLTYVITEGMKGKADGNKDGYVSTLELADYVEVEVPVIAEQVFKRAQYPMTSKSGHGFPLVKVK